MKTLFILIIGILTWNQCVDAQAPGIDWFVHEGTGTNERGYSITRDFNGDAIVGIRFRGTVEIGGQSFTKLGSSNNYDRIIAKFDSNGGFLWANHVYCNGDFTNAVIKLDGSGNIYIYSHFDGNLTIGTITLTESSNGGHLLAKYDNNGTLIWAKNAATTTGNGGGLPTMDVSTTGDIIFTNWAYDQLIINGNTHTVDPDFGNTFFAKYNSNGDYVWHTINSPPGWLKSHSISWSNSGFEFYITGAFSGDFDFGGGNAFTSFGNSDVYVAKFFGISSASLQWVVQVGGSELDRFDHLVVDNDNCIIGIGVIGTTASFGNNVSISTVEPSIVVAKYDNTGKCQFAEKIANPNSSFLLTSFSNDIEGNLYFSGSFLETITFNHNGEILTSNGGTDALIAKLDSDGILLWVLNYGGSLNETGVADTYLDNEVYFTGGFQGSVDFGNSSYNAVGDADVFIAKLSGCELPNLTINSAGSTIICNGESVVLTASDIPNSTYQWFRNNSPILNAASASFEATQEGNYFVIADAGACSDTSNIIIVSVSNVVVEVVSIPPNINGICQGSSLQLTTSLPFANYLWSNGTTGVLNEITEPGKHSVTVTDFSNCTDSAFFNIIQYPTPTEPMIIVDTTTCTLACDTTLINGTYKWRLNGMLVGSNSQFHDASSSGSGFYTIEITDVNGCKAISSPLSVNIGVCSTTNIENAVVDESFFSVFPNPNSGNFQVRLSPNITAEITIYNNLGIVVFEDKFNSNYAEINLPIRLKGVYIVEVLDLNSNRRGVKKLILN